MSNLIGPNEVRVVIRPVEDRGDDFGPIPAELFKKTFDAFLTALMVTDRELQPKARSSEFLISHLALDPYEFGILEKRRAFGQATPSAIEFFRRCAEGIYRSDYQTVVRRPRVTRAFIRIIKGLDPSFHVLAQFNDAELPIDDFFRRQVDRVGLKDDAARTDNWFLGSAIMSFEGRLDEIDYRGAVWTGELMLPAGTTHIECVFDKSQGEDVLNPFGNKNVCITGRAIYTGDSQLPERIEVLTIEERSHVRAAIDIRGSLRLMPLTDEDNGLDTVE
ncbi:MAG TPA: hypothetical protein VN637_17500 [Roseiarcus sp.]|jgi:hypothetical protein|nr:hypothetical protein [Roseiarcus sp.]